MVRIFNIYFTYEEILHNAVVSVRTTEEFTEYILGNLDYSLRDVLPGNKIIEEEGNLVFQNVLPEHPHHLMKIIIKSINDHLHTATSS